MARYAVVGAGAAGLSAGRTLAAAGHEVRIFEARAIPGGRIRTDYSLGSHAVELGAEFIHGERVSTWDWVREFGAPTSGAAHRYEMWYHVLEGLLDARAGRDYFGTQPLFAVEQLIDRWVAGGRHESTLDQVFELWPEISQQTLTADRRRLIENYMTELASSDMGQLGTHRTRPDPAEQRETLINFRLTDGYDALISQVAAPLNIAYSTPVQRIRWDENRAEVTTPEGTERFDGAVVALPLGVLRRETVRFDPGLPESKMRAIREINAGHISKIILKLDRVYWPPEMSFLWTHLSTQVWWRPGDGQPEETPIISGFFGGSDAAALEGATVEEATEEGTRQLSEILGVSLAGRVVESRYVAWGSEEHTWMGYSSLPPGGAGLRSELAMRLGSMTFAGEATSQTHAATVHGAIESGRRAARELLDSPRLI